MSWPFGKPPRSFSTQHGAPRLRRLPMAMERGVSALPGWGALGVLHASLSTADSEAIGFEWRKAPPPNAYHGAPRLRRLPTAPPRCDGAGSHGITCGSSGGVSAGDGAFAGRG